MADIKNKNELKRRIELFLDELDYSINEDFCKETMKMMREFIGHASNRLDCEEIIAKSLKKKLKEYEDLEYKLNGISIKQVVDGFIKTIENQTCCRTVKGAEIYLRRKSSPESLDFAGFLKVQYPRYPPKISEIPP